MFVRHVLYGTLNVFVAWEWNKSFILLYSEETSVSLGGGILFSACPWFRPHLRCLLYTLMAFVRFCSNLHHTITITQCIFGRKIGAEGQYYKSYATL